MKIVIFYILIFAFNFFLTSKCFSETNQINPAINLLLLGERKFNINDNFIRKFQPGEYIKYDTYGSYQDTYVVLYGGAIGCYLNPIKYGRGLGLHSFRLSSYELDDLPGLTNSFKSTAVGSFFISESEYEINQENNGNYTVYMCKDGSKPNYPKGINLIESPLDIGKSWSHDQSCNDILKTDYKVINKEFINTPLGKFETFKINYTSYGSWPETACWELWNESGNIWIHPKVGIIKQSFSAERNCKTTGCHQKIYNIELIINST